MTTKIATTSIRSSSILSMMLVATVALLIGLSVQYIADRYQQQQALLTQARVLAEMTAANAGTALLFDDAAAEERRLIALASVADVDSAQIFKRDRSSDSLHPFAAYHRPGTVPVWSEIGALATLKRGRLEADLIEVSQPVVFDGEVIGQLYLRLTTASLRRQLASSITVGALSLILALSCALLLALRQQRQVSQPLEALAAVAQRVAQSRDFSLRAPELPLQELQVLATTFNTVLERVERQLARQQDAENQIRQLNDNLEQQVSQRTAALREANADLLAALEQQHLYQAQLLDQQQQTNAPPALLFALTELEELLLLLELANRHQPTLLPHLLNWSRQAAASAREQRTPASNPVPSNSRDLVATAVDAIRLRHPQLKLDCRIDDAELPQDSAQLGLVLLGLFGLVHASSGPFQLRLAVTEQALRLQLQLPMTLTSDQRRLLAGGTSVNEFDQAWAAQLARRVRLLLGGELDFEDSAIRITIPICSNSVNAQ
ncbi:MAG: HAMP domain-containing protein [Gammaproteobacteria bacterium]|nr:HAMP domain-containing protein [Gammaproteobacteria bacterium]